MLRQTRGIPRSIGNSGTALCSPALIWMRCTVRRWSSMSIPAMKFPSSVRVGNKSSLVLRISRATSIPVVTYSTDARDRQVSSKVPSTWSLANASASTMLLDLLLGGLALAPERPAPKGRPDLLVWLRQLGCRGPASGDEAVRHCGVVDHDIGECAVITVVHLVVAAFATPAHAADLEVFLIGGQVHVEGLFANH